MYKAEDRAVNVLVGVDVEVQFGPVETQMGKTAYLVKDQGQSYLLWEEDMTPAPRFKVGSLVKFSYSSAGEFYEVVAGPYPTSSQDVDFWVIKDRSGVHDTAFEKYMVPVVE